MAAKPRKVNAVRAAGAAGSVAMRRGGEAYSSLRWTRVVWARSTWLRNSRRIASHSARVRQTRERASRVPRSATVRQITRLVVGLGRFRLGAARGLGRSGGRHQKGAGKQNQALHRLLLMDPLAASPSMPRPSERALRPIGGIRGEKSSECGDLAYLVLVEWKRPAELSVSSAARHASRLSPFVRLEIRSAAISNWAGRWWP